MFTYIDWLIHLQHHEDLLREAEQETLARLAVSARPPSKVEKKATIDKSNKLNAAEVVCCASGTA